MENCVQQAACQHTSGRSAKMGRGIYSVCVSLLAAMFLGAVSCGAEAANWYVRPNGGGYGAKNGTDWNNAFNGFSGISWGAVACGDTIWVAGGNYTQALLPAKKCTSTARLSIRRARGDASAATSAAGWTSSFDSTVHQTDGILFNGDWDYITISGRTQASGGSNGWWMDFRGRTAGAGIEIANNASADYNVIEYMDLQGPGNITYSGNGRAIDGTAFSNAEGNVFSHLKIWEWESAIYVAGIHGTVFEWLDVFDIQPANWSAYHPNGLYAIGSTRTTVRYSKFHKGPKGYGTGEGIFFQKTGGCSDWKIYGNVFYNLDYSGLKAIELASSVPNLKIYNNTFDNVLAPLYLSAATCATGAEMKNNLFYATSAASCGATSNNLAATTNPFVNRSGGDYHIVSTVGAGYPRNAGTNLSAVFTTDMDGNVFGADGAWDIGAYEYATASPTLQPPANLRVVR